MRPFLLLCLVVFPQVTAAQESEEAGVLRMTEALAVPTPGQSFGRTVIHTDSLELALVRGEWQTPQAGDVIERPGGDAVEWREVVAGDKGFVGIEGVRSCYVLWTVALESAAVMELFARGHSFVYVNGEIRVGNPYRKGYVRYPVALQAGANELLFKVSRGAVKAQLSPVEGGVQLTDQDATLPDAFRETGGGVQVAGSILVRNATEEWQRGFHLDTTFQRTDATGNWRSAKLGGDGGQPLSVSLPPLSAAKVPFLFPRLSVAEDEEAAVRLAAPDDSVLTVDLRVRDAGQPYRETFLSDIDGSAQYYAVRPAAPRPGDESAPALFLSLHGASVEAQGQARSYSAKTWGHVVAPTNRRPFGFDWEDWGRLDAIEVLELASARLGTDPLRQYVTGHSMGGHGTWHMGVTFPDRFAAVGPSAGWVSFWSYGGGGRFDEEATVQAMLKRASSPSDTLGLIQNLAPLGVYILHGDADDNVPVEQARTMREALGEFHRDFHWHEEPGKGHWWNKDDEPGADCVDWAPMFDLFARRSLPPFVREVDFRTASPGVSADCHWARIEQQERALEISHVSLRCDPHRRRFIGTTENVRRMSLSLAHLEPTDEVVLQLDGGDQVVPWPTDADRLHLLRGADGWAATTAAPASEKGPHRSGLFRDAFRHRAVLVVGTRGDSEQNAWALARARLDSETFWVRANGSFDVMTDEQYLADPVDPDRNVILYGNAETNAAWDTLLGSSPLQVRPGQITLGDRTFAGDDLCALFLRPRPGSNQACVGAIAGTGLPGMRLTNCLPTFVSGVGIPDVLILSSAMLENVDAGLQAAGFFGNDWSIEHGDFAFGD